MHPLGDSSPGQVSLRELAAVFLKLGTTAFGGPAAHIAMMEQEFVRRRAWLSTSEFLDRLAAANLLPGPSSTEVAILVGYRKRGWMGLVVAGFCFILPAAILVGLIAAAYVRFGSLPQLQGVLYAIKPVVVAIIVQALWNLGRTAIKNRILLLVGAGSTVLSLCAVNPMLVLVLAGTVAGMVLWRTRNPPALFSLAGLTVPGTVAGSSGTIGLARLFLSFLKIGSVVFGSGYVLLAFLRTEFIDHLHWLTEKQLLDAVAVGQFTPGPLFTTATFIGYILAGIPGAAVATLGIFLPGFVLVAVSGPLVPKIRRSPTAGAVLDGVVAGSLALMGVVTWQLGRAAISDWLTLLLAVASVVILLRFRVNAAWLIGAAAVLGIVVRSQ